MLTTYTWPDYKVANAILMKFDLSSLPPGAVVQDAKLFLALVQSDLTLAPTYTVSCEQGARQQPRDRTGDRLHRRRRHDLDAERMLSRRRAARPVGHLAAVSTEAIDKMPGFKSWTITTMLQEWLANPSTNFGLVLNSDASKPRDHFRFFASMEHPVATLRPFLRVTFSQGGDRRRRRSPSRRRRQEPIVSGAVTITADANDDTGVAGVQLRLNGATSAAN